MLNPVIAMLPFPEVDIRALWISYIAVFRYWFVGIGLIAKPLVVRFVLNLPWATSFGTGSAMHLVASIVVAFFPVALLLSLGLTEGLMRHVAGMENLGLISWICPVVVFATVATISEALLLSFVFKGKASRKLLLSLLVANTVCTLMAGYMLIAFVTAHPPEA